ncbi:uncharacterized protein [Amphiura filiformis]|uniref:uncharacterized protein n=1 Tax=Amphiura filiformis TaxID=82378 RepID=UPI003B227074
MSDRKAAKRKACDNSTQPIQETTGDKASSSSTHINGADVTDDTMQCSGDSPGQAPPRRSHRLRSTTTEEKLEQLEIWVKVLKDPYVHEKLTQCINGYDLLVYFPYMPRAQADKIKAVHTHQGQTTGAEELLEHLLKLANGENDWPQDLRTGLQYSGHDLLVDLLDETYVKKKTGIDDVPPGGLCSSMTVGEPNENYDQDITPAARAVLQHRELWTRTFRENKRAIIEYIEPNTMLPYLPYLPRDRIRAVCENQGETRGAGELIESMFSFTDKAWMKEFIDALRTPRINHNLLADLLTNHFIDLVEKTENDPKYKDLHAVYSKSDRDTGEECKFIYYGAKTLEPKDLGKAKTKLRNVITHHNLEKIT